MEPQEVQEDTAGSPRLRSADEITGYHVESSDGELGHVDDVVIDDEDWFLLYLVVDARKWLPGRKVLLATLWAEGLSWSTQKICTNISQERVRNLPPNDPGMPVNREYETRLYDYYGRVAYWPKEKPRDR